LTVLPRDAMLVQYVCNKLVLYHNAAWSHVAPKFHLN